MDIIEHNNVAPLITLIDEVEHKKRGQWIVASIKREYLKPITNEAFMMAIKPVMQSAEEIHVYFSGSKNIHMAWNGDLKAVYKQLRGIVISILSQPGAMDAIISYSDPHLDATNIKNALKEEVKALGKDPTPDRGKKTHGHRSTNDPLGWNDDNDDNDDAEGVVAVLSATPEQIQHFNTIKNQKRYRKQMHILVVEDHAFYQKLLCEIIRGVRIVGVEAPIADVADGLKTAWNLFLKKAHDIVFVDLGLSDGSGHALARAIKEIDSTACVIIVTGNNYEEEVGVAQQNNVDGFITKPYSKKQILDFIEKYSQALKSKNKGSSRA